MFITILDLANLTIHHVRETSVNLDAYRLVNLSFTSVKFDMVYIPGSQYKLLHDENHMLMCDAFFDDEVEKVYINRLEVSLN